MSAANRLAMIFPLMWWALPCQARVGSVLSVSIVTRLSLVGIGVGVAGVVGILMLVVVLRPLAEPFLRLGVAFVPKLLDEAPAAVELRRASFADRSVQPNSAYTIRAALS